jgi:hypothetical protein
MVSADSTDTSVYTDYALAASASVHHALVTFTYTYVPPAYLSYAFASGTGSQRNGTGLALWVLLIPLLLLCFGADSTRWNSISIFHWRNSLCTFMRSFAQSFN